jgi:hypothetical protein
MWSDLLVAFLISLPALIFGAVESLTYLQQKTRRPVKKARDRSPAPLSQRSLQCLDRRRGGSRGGGGGRPRWGGRLRSGLIFWRRLIWHRLTVAWRDTSVRA